MTMSTHHISKFELLKKIHNNKGEIVNVMIAFVCKSVDHHSSYP